MVQREIEDLRPDLAEVQNRLRRAHSERIYMSQMKIQTGTIVVIVMTTISTIILAFFLILLRLVTLRICCYDDMLQFHAIVTNCYS